LLTKIDSLLHNGQGVRCIQSRTVYEHGEVITYGPWQYLLIVDEHAWQRRRPTPGYGTGWSALTWGDDQQIYFHNVPGRVVELRILHEKDLARRVRYVYADAAHITGDYSLAEEYDPEAWLRQRVLTRKEAACGEPAKS